MPCIVSFRTWGLLNRARLPSKDLYSAKLISTAAARPRFVRIYRSKRRLAFRDKFSNCRLASNTERMVSIKSEGLTGKISLNACHCSPPIKRPINWLKLLASTDTFPRRHFSSLRLNWMHSLVLGCLSSRCPARISPLNRCRVSQKSMNYPDVRIVT